MVNYIISLVYYLPPINGVMIQELIITTKLGSYWIPCGKKTELAIFTILSTRSTSKSLLYQKVIITTGQTHPTTCLRFTKSGRFMLRMVMKNFIKPVQIPPVYFSRELHIL